MITENLSTLKIHKLTQEQYERELAAGRIDENALYLTDVNNENFLNKTGDIMTGPLGLTLDVGYGQNFPVNGAEGQIFFLEDTSSNSPSLPPITDDDNGKFLKIVNGKLAWVSIPNAESLTF